MLTEVNEAGGAMLRSWAMTGSDSSEQATRSSIDFWNVRHRNPEEEDHDNFLNHPMVQAYSSMRAFAGTLIGHLDALIAELSRRTNPGDCIVSVGCGLAGKERSLAKAMPDRRVLGLDIADEILTIAKLDLEGSGIDNLQLVHGDFNHLELEENSCKVVLGMGAIHHVEALEGFWESCRKALTPGGMVFGQEYIGPNRFQWTEAQIECGNRALAEIVPKEHRVDHERIDRVPIETMISLDPSEAVRSAEILTTCKQAGYEIDAYTGAGGALLQPVLMRQIHSFDPQNWQHNHVLATLFAEEDRLMSMGTLGDDFAMFIVTPPS